MKEKYVSYSCKLPLMHLKDFFPFFGERKVLISHQDAKVWWEMILASGNGAKTLSSERELFILHHIFFFRARRGGKARRRQ